MSLILLNRKFEKLSDKEKHTNKYFDPRKKLDQPHHRHADDLLQDQKEELKNYGFQRYDWKNNKEYKLALEDQEEEFIQESLDDLPATDKKDDHKRKSLSTYLSLNDKKRATPINARPQTAASNRGYASSGEPGIAGETDLNQQKDPLCKEAKGWKNTKKFDIGYKDLIRNASAVTELQFQSSMAKKVNETKDELIARRLNEEKLIVENPVEKNTYGKVVHASYSVRSIMRMGISEEEKEDNYLAFRDACEFLNLKDINSDASPNLKVVKSPRTVSSEGKSFSKPTSQLKQPKIKNKPKQTRAQLEKNNGGILSENSAKLISNVSNDGDLSFNDPRSIRRKDMQYVREQFEVLTSHTAILEQMRSINYLVFGCDKLFLKNIVENNFSEKENWHNLLGENGTFTVITIDVYSLTMIIVRNASVSETGSLRIIKKKKEMIFDLKTLLNSMGELRKSTENQTSQEGCLYYTLILSENEKQEQIEIKYEKFIYFGIIGQPIEKEISDRISLFYLRFLMSFDKSEKLTLSGILENSHVIIINRRKIPANLQKFFEKLKREFILIEDKRGRRKYLVYMILMKNIHFEEDLKGSPVVKDMRESTNRQVAPKNIPKPNGHININRKKSDHDQFINNIKRPLSAAGSIKSGNALPRNESYASDRLPSDIFDQIQYSAFDDVALNQYLRPQTAITRSALEFENNSLSKSGTVKMKSPEQARPKTANLISYQDPRLKAAGWTPKNSLELVKGFQKKEFPKRNTSPTSFLSIEGRSVVKVFK